MLTTRGLGVALLFVLGCDPSATRADPPAAQIEQAVVASDSHHTAELRRPAASALASTEPAITYARTDWPHWIDADHDCQDTRTEVLIDESYEPIGFEEDRRCEVAVGRWQCPYTGKIIREVHLLDVDHLVPLANAHRSGAATWTTEQRRRYANDLEHGEHLVAVEYAANRSKGDKGPEAWLPTSEDYRCSYVRDWVTIKQRWRLGMNQAEAAAIGEALETCEAGRIPPLPQTQRRTSKDDAAPRGAKPTAQTVPAEPSERVCCRVCKKGKACGDSCIAATSNCTKPSGCACDG
ncbi:putative secreted protein [Enhygromyxa salina]|uniref:Putative secreted protein n=1 Tax=Enhygromyxa salina TaxID=215803 RepID=A0A0C2D1M2_9BACT|nr:HNH endonuclease family protein [Enhygromyxa salina]KIG17141.1 putative secreted protein [Enhygromyxa salina]